MLAVVQSLCFFVLYVVSNNIGYCFMQIQYN